MHKIKEVLRQRLVCGLSLREIGRSLSISHPTVKKYLLAAQKAALTWQKAEEMSDWDLFQLVRTRQEHAIGKSTYPMPDYASIHQEIKKKGVTLALLWQEYKESNPEGYQYTQFREYYRAFKNKLNVSLRQTYKAGEKMFVDYAGQTVPVHDRHTGQVRQAQIFVGVLGASNYTYAQGSWDQGLPNWIDAHIHSFEYFQGVPGVVICDNLKAGVTRACRYEPEINLTYADMAAHYGTVIIPARVGRPQDKAKVETAVLIVERWILARLRNRKFFTLEELNEAIRELLVRLNQRLFKKLDGSRESVFKTIDQPALKQLPSLRYEVSLWKKARVNIDYHVELDGHYYSAPYQLAHEEVMLKITARVVEVLYHGRRVASHALDNRRGRHTTIKEHMPKSHQQYLEWTPSRIIDMSQQIGSHTAGVVEYILGSRQYPELGYRSCLGILRLSKAYSRERVEAACKRALAIRACSYKSVRSILESGLDKQAVQEPVPHPVIAHENVRGTAYFNPNQEVM
ncbi:MAG: IS21 family transposase [Bdellovibrionota bacterium]